MYYLNKKSSRFNKSSNQRALPIYITFRVLIYALLGYSVWATANFLAGSYFKGLEYAFIIGLGVGLLVAFAIERILDYVLTEYLADKGRISWLILVLLPIMLINSYSDWHGVNLYSEKKVKDIVYTSPVDSLYNLQRKDLNIQLSEVNQIIKSNKNWNSYSPENGKWTKHHKWQKATKQKEKINTELQKLASSHNTNKADELAIYQTTKTKREAKVKLLSDSFRGGVLACNILIILLSYWCSKYEYDYSKVNTFVNTQTLDKQESTQFVQTQTNIDSNSLSDIQISENGLSLGVNDSEIEGLLLDGNSVRTTAKLLGIKDYKVAKVSKRLRERGDLK